MCRKEHFSIYDFESTWEVPIRGPLAVLCAGQGLQGASPTGGVCNPASPLLVWRPLSKETVVTPRTLLALEWDVLPKAGLEAQGSCVL